MRDTDVIGRIYELCSARGWSWFMLSKRTGVPYSTISNMLHRKTMPSLSTLQKICDGMNITLNYFFCGRTEDLSGNPIRADEPELRMGEKYGALLFAAYAEALGLQTEVV